MLKCSKMDVSGSQRPWGNSEMEITYPIFVFGTGDITFPFSDTRLLSSFSKVACSPAPKNVFRCLDIDVSLGNLLS